MNFVFKIRSVAILLIASIFFVGCTEVSRNLGKMTANKFAEPRSGSLWAVPPPQLEPVSASKKQVYISFRNISDADIDLINILKTAATSQGWQIVNDPAKATYRLRASLRFWGEVDPESGGAGAAAALGGIAGAAVGLGTYAAMGANSYGDAAVGVAAGGLVAAGLTNASRPREWALICDFVLEEYSAKAVEFSLSRDTGSTTASGAGAANGRTAIGGSTAESNTSKGTITKKSNYFPHGIRLSVWANQMNMKEEEALPLVQERAEKVVKQMLPM